MADSRLPGFYRLGIAARLEKLVAGGWLAAGDAALLGNGGHILNVRAADRMIENVIATFGLPLAIAPNFRVNGRDYIVPLVVEEPSIVAALSDAARRARAGGFEVTCDESLLTGQVHLAEIDDAVTARRRIEEDIPALIAAANAVHPRLGTRGGGVREIELREINLDDGKPVLAVHLHIDTRDAMGANLVNTICEAMAPRLAELAGGEVAMSILSNLADRSIVTARVTYPLDALADSERDAILARDAIVRAARIAHADPYRAATHNKGIMNGIDPLAIATGNDWRAIEAGAHAYAARDGRYRPLTAWRVADDGSLCGELEMPIKAGIVGGTLDANKAAGIGLRLCAVRSAKELGMLMGAVGLAQNFAAIRALATTGIQRGHMRLHARSVAASAGVPDALFDDVVSELVASGEIKDWKAREILAARDTTQPAAAATAAGKCILVGEHAVVYGRHAVALPIPQAVAASVSASTAGTRIDIPEWGVSRQLNLQDKDTDGLTAIVATIAQELGIDVDGLAIHVRSSLPHGMGLGASAAIAVAVARALSEYRGLSADDERINAVAFACEKHTHGTPSGIDNSVATFNRPLLFRNAGKLELTEIALHTPPPIVIACSGTAGLTAGQVAGVRARRDRNPARYDALFDEMDEIALAASAALTAGDTAELGALLNIAHGLLNALEVSTPELEQMVSIARAAGAAGAKLTGAGGGGSIVALCPGAEDTVSGALSAAGYQTMTLSPQETPGND